MAEIRVYGIPNCDTVKKARRWLDANGIDHGFHDLRADGVTPDMLARWAADAGWHSLLNKRSTTFRKLDNSVKEQAVQDRDTALALMMQHPTLIKRPVLEIEGRVLIGFNESEWENALC